METKSGLTIEQVTKLGDVLIDTTKSVYSTAKTMFDADVEDEVFEDLAQHFKIFKCESCNVWPPLREKDPDFEDQCTDCARDE